jgi:hypothetical protein
MTDASAGTPPGAVRLIFEYEGDQVRLLQQQRVDVAVPGFDLPSETRPGHYVEIRSAANDTLARVPIRGAFVGGAEVFPEQHDQPITRVDTGEQKGAFTVVVPAPEAADHVSVVRVSSPHPDAPTVAARATSPVTGASQVVELASFPLEVTR